MPSPLEPDARARGERRPGLLRERRKEGRRCCRWKLGRGGPSSCGEVLAIFGTCSNFLKAGAKRLETCPLFIH